MTFDGVPKQFLTSVRVLFDILDTKKLGYVNFCDIEARWNKENTDKLPADVVECLRNSSVNGQLTFELFVSGLQQSLKAAASKPGSPYQGGDAPPKPFKPVNLQQHGSETISSPLRTSQAAVEPIYQKPPRTSSRNYEQNGRAQSIADIPAQPITSPQHRPPYRESDAYRKQTPKRRDNSRRHTLGHGVDGSMVRRSKLLEEERRMLLKGLQSVDKVKNWYTKRLAEVADRQRYGVLEADNSNTDQQQERVAFEQLRISEPSGKVRVCGDFKQLNQRISIDQHPLPKLDDLMEKLRGGVYFSKLDLADAYLQLELDDEAKKLCVINTPFGLYRYNRMCFGIASSPAQFQRCMDSLTVELPGVAAYLDDLIITGSTVDEHWANLNRLLAKLQEHGFRLRLDKCEFFKTSVEYLGHVIDKEGKRPSESSIAALKQLPIPQDTQQVKAFLGKITYYGRFISNLADKAAPLYNLLKDGVSFAWTNSCQQAFTKLKKDVINATNLSHYDESQTLVLATDASSYGVGAVLSQQDADGNETPIAYSSKTLTETQKKYSQIEREALSIIYGVTKFRQYLYGRKFILLTDHEPLVSIFSPQKNIPSTTAQRLQRWALTLMAFQYDIAYKKTSKHGNADALSRLPLGIDEQFDAAEHQEDMEVSHTIREEIHAFPLDSMQIKRATQNDDTLQKVVTWIHEGWPNNKPTEPELQLLWAQRESLVLHDNIVLLQRDTNSRVVVPKALQTTVLETLHSSHWGVVKVKQLARRYVWWSSLNADIEKLTKACDVCKQLSAAPTQCFTEWPKTEHPWERVHLDFAGPFKDKMWLICIDAHSKFPYMGKMEIGQTSAKQTIQVLKDIFSLEGLPNTVVTDNGPQFTSSDFEAFCKQHGISHITSPPHHPPSNGEAERFVQTFKRSVEKNCVGGVPLTDSVRLTLATYRSLPHPALEWKTPAEVLHGRQPRCLLSLINPFNTRNYQTKSNNNTSSQFAVNSLVYARNYSSGPKWVPGKIIRRVGNTIFLVDTDRGIWKRHCNQLQIRLATESMPNDESIAAEPTPEHSQYPTTRRYPQRIRKAPERYEP
ncbi:hypothetical protein EB796_006640 [Bugula neritina]|uniref:Uncharacterized protein n=2 Tax=Bugula neritina TaxID=10212 RepID=A0A7J7KAR9_BUGNE|nr:hypothetical protein EB796_006640 [Bugula neritina]